MAEMWFYTTEGTQQNPVAFAELRRLFGEGVLKPTDMVWKEGMERWIRASSVRELFAEPTARLEVSPAARSIVPAVALDEPGLQKGSAADDREGAPRRRVPVQNGGSNAGVVFVLVLGALLLLGALGVGIFILIFVVAPSDAPEDFKIKIEGNTLTYKARLKPNGDDARWFRFRKGVQYEITVRTEPRFPDVDLHIIQRGGKELAFDDNPGPDSFVRFTPAEEIVCRVELRNLDPGSQAVSTVRITPPPTEVKNEAAPAEPVKEQPLPADVKEGKGLDTSISVPIGKEVPRKFRIRAGHKASFRFVPTGAGLKADFNIIVVKDSDPTQIIAQGIGPEARASLSLTVPATEIVLVRIVNSTPKGAGGGTLKGALSYDVSP